MFDSYTLHMIISGGTTGNPRLIRFRQPRLLKLQFDSWPYLRGLNFLLQEFSEISSLEIIIKGHCIPVDSAPSAIGQELVYLKLNMTTFEPFDLTTYLGPNLEELHIRHDGMDSASRSTTTLQLPQLKVLGVTPLDTDFANSLDLPALKKIILYGPRASEIPTLSLAQFADNPNFKSVRDIEVREWPLFKPKQEEEWCIMKLMGDIVEKMRSVESLRCVGSVIKGSELVKLVSALKDTTETTGSKLEYVVLDCCTGITRDQSDEVSTLVGKLEIYM
jgi:hypothetical protein